MQPTVMAGAGSRHARTDLAAKAVNVSRPTRSCALAMAIAAETEDQRVAIGIAGQPKGRFR